MQSDLKGLKVLLTGAGGGIGRAAAVALAAEGARLFLCGARRVEKSEETAAAVRKAGGEAFLLPGDLTDDAFARAAADRAAEALGGLDVLINNAGAALNRPFEETTPEEFDRLFALNVRVPFLLCRGALPHLRRSDRAAIVNVASVTAHAGYPDQAAYSASKHALLGLTKSLAAEVYGEGIRVHAVSPGGVLTDMVRIARPDLTGAEMILPEEVAETILFLLKFRGNGVVDEIRIHRKGKTPFAE